MAPFMPTVSAVRGWSEFFFRCNDGHSNSVIVIIVTKYHTNQANATTFFSSRPCRNKPRVISNINRYFFDFGKEVMGGIRLSVGGSKEQMIRLEGTTVTLRLGESLMSERVLRFPM
jgi:hypothetical protein